MSKRQKPTVYIVAGSNGSGKTTFARKFLPKYAGRHIDFINAYLIASGLSPLNSDKMVIQASRIVLQRIKELSESKKDFAFETTLSGRSYSVLLRRIKKMGYRVHLFYLWIPNYKLAIERIRERVREGGHNVPAEIVRRRFAKTLDNLFHMYLPLIDYLIMFDNSSENPKIIFEKKGKVIYTANYDRVLEIMTEANWSENEK